MAPFFTETTHKKITQDTRDRSDSSRMHKPRPFSETKLCAQEKKKLQQRQQHTHTHDARAADATALLRQ